MDRPLGPVGVPAPLVARDVSDARARARAATVIRHRPGGRGHAYLVDLDQRVPVQPVAGTTLELRVTTSISCESVHVELQRGGSALAIAAAEFQPPASEAVGEGHLAASTSAQPPAGRRPWRVVLDDLVADETLRYRFVSPEGTTRWHETTVAGWRRQGGTLEGARAEDAEW